MKTKRNGINDRLAVVVITVLVFSLALVGTKPGSQIKQFSSYEELESFVKNSAVSSDVLYAGVSRQMMQTTAESVAPAAEKSADYSKTNVQVSGVDEADIVKNDGKFLYIVSGNKVVIVDAYPAESARIVSEINFAGSPSEIFINKDRLVVFASDYGYSSVGFAPDYYSPKTLIHIYDVTDRANPVLSKNITADGSYFDSRMTGEYVYVITNRPVNYGTEPQPIPLPVISTNGVAKAIPASDIYYFDSPDVSYIFTNIVAINMQGDDVSSKTFLMGYTQTLYASAENIYIVYAKQLSMINFMNRLIDEAIIPSVPVDVQLRIKETGNASVYEKMQAIGKILESYLETLNPEQKADVMLAMEQRMAAVQTDIVKQMEKTVIHKISVSGSNIEYKAQGEVPGRVLNQFSMDERNGYFRIATTTSGNSGIIMPMRTFALAEIESDTSVATGSASAPAASVIRETRPVIAPQPASSSQNHVYILDGNLQIISKIEDLAPGERIYSVRFIGDRGYMVTFRQVDPLFVIDLNPVEPKVIGFLKIPGVSDYLHPYDENHIIGVGRDATEEGRVQGMKLSLFDVTDVSSPKEMSKYIIGKRGTYSEALNDHKAFMFSREKSLLVIPVTEVTDEQTYKTWSGAYVFGVDLSGFTLKGKVSHDLNQTGDYYYGYSTQIRRSLYIGDVLYTVSSGLVKMNSISGMSEINAVALPGGEPVYYAVKGL